MDIRIEIYQEQKREKWEQFVSNEAINGTFQQTRRFLDYHGTRFKDTSLIVYKGDSTIIAVIPACTIVSDHLKEFVSHAGSTFGGIVIGKNFYDIEHLENIMIALDAFFVEQKYDKVTMKLTGQIFSEQDMSLLYYFFFNHDYKGFMELSNYKNLKNCLDNITEMFSSRKRRDYKYSLKNNMQFRQIYSDEDLKVFYNILCQNLKKFNSKPIHTWEELVDFKNIRLKNEVEFYGVFLNECMIAGSMIFLFGDKVFHTQYLAADQDYLKHYPMEFLDANLIMTARARGFSDFSFGTSTHEQGKILNKHLAQFKEGFGTEFTLNYIFEKRY